MDVLYYYDPEMLGTEEEMTGQPGKSFPRETKKR